MNRIGPKKAVRFIDSLLSAPNVRLYCATRAKNHWEQEEEKNSTWNWNLRSRQQATERSHKLSFREPEWEFWVSCCGFFGDQIRLRTFLVWSFECVYMQKRWNISNTRLHENEANSSFQRLRHIFSLSTSSACRCVNFITRFIYAFVSVVFGDNFHVVRLVFSAIISLETRTEKRLVSLIEKLSSTHERISGNYSSPQRSYLTFEKMW